jgi:hypothetical protein
MEILERSEPVRRHIYTGSIGYLDWSGDADWNIAIRTALVTPTAVHFAAGGGITADSDADAEYRETLHKAEGMRAALGACWARPLEPRRSTRGEPGPAAADRGAGAPARRDALWIDGRCARRGGGALAVRPRRARRRGAVRDAARLRRRPLHGSATWSGWCSRRPSWASRCRPRRAAARGLGEVLQRQGSRTRSRASP